MELNKNRAYKYIELCEYFGEDVKSGSSKTAQINRWRRYYDLEKVGSKYLVVSDKHEPPPKLPNPQASWSAMNKVGDDRLAHLDIAHEDLHKSGIYKIYNKETKEIYIGQTTDFQKRFRQHWCNDCNLYSTTYDMLHNGAVFSVIEICDDADERLNKESDYIIEYILNADYICMNKRNYKASKWKCFYVDKERSELVEQFLKNNGINYKF
ncbi:MAG: GIY-YIG nuclease family protein [bacterium]|nr:GIY-YIG nuclease family protein [bacterium]